MYPPTPSPGGAAQHIFRLYLCRPSGALHFLYLFIPTQLALWATIVTPLWGAPGLALDTDRGLKQDAETFHSTSEP